MKLMVNDIDYTFECYKATIPENELSMAVANEGDVFAVLKQWKHNAESLHKKTLENLLADHSDDEVKSCYW